jgi:hypothetical protein
VCKNKYYLFNKRCFATCPAGFEGKGTGNFHRVCLSSRRRRDLSLSCDADPDCGACQSDGISCALCENGKVLLNGTCVSECPAGFEVAGTVAKRCKDLLVNTGEEGEQKAKPGKLFPWIF